jgi:hypothetical protein
MSDRKGDWILTSTGRRFWPLDPRPEDIDIEDIAHALSHLCRYGGHCREYYSVAQHSVLVSYICPPNQALWGLLHDAAEAYLCDVPRPIKTMLPGYATMEGIVMAAIIKRFNLTPTREPDEVRLADNVLLATEMRDLMRPNDWIATNLKGVHPLADPVLPIPPRDARLWFLTRYSNLRSQRDGLARCEETAAPVEGRERG